MIIAFQTDFLMMENSSENHFAVMEDKIHY